MVEHFEGKVRGAESDISDILKQERTEKELRLAEMEANKASNLMKHAAAIAARPARTWYVCRPLPLRTLVRMCLALLCVSLLDPGLRCFAPWGLYRCKTLLASVASSSSEQRVRALRFQNEKEKKAVVSKWRDDQDRQLRGPLGAWSEVGDAWAKGGAEGAEDG